MEVVDPLVGIWGHVDGSEGKQRWAFDAYGQAFYDNNQHGAWTRVADASYVIKFPEKPWRRAAIVVTW